jgi:acyl-homoserine-lactone acylase
MVPELSPDARAMVTGFAAGYDHWLARSGGAAALPQPCRDAPWVQPIEPADVLAVVLSTASLASSRFLEPQVARAAPATTSRLTSNPARPGASNAWALGADRTASGGGILVANPHFPWEGDLAFFEAHLTIPGDLDVYGATLIGIPGIAIGATAHHAWSHTFSSSTHMVLYRVDLEEQSAVRYRHGGDTVPIVAATYRVDVLVDGKLEARTRTLYRSAVGPMVASDLTPWDGAGGHAFTVRDVAVASAAQLDQPLAMARARSRDDFERALALSATPFVNTLYADAGGDALYVDGSRVPALSEQAIAGWQIMRKVVPQVDAAWQRGVVVLDGSNPLYDLETFDPGAPGALPVSQAPRLLRRDFVMNANDSYRYTNLDAAETAAAHSPLYGDDEGRPSPRTLMNLAMLRPGDAAAGDDGRFTLDEAAAAMLSNRSFTAERLRDDVLAACGPAAGKPRTPSPCDIVRAWDGRFTAGSRGAVLWRELMAVLAGDGAVAWKRPFDPQAPVLTPDGLDRSRGEIVEAVAEAAGRLRRRGVDPAAPLGEVQHTTRGTARVPLPGGDGNDGVANVVGNNPFNFTLLPRTPRDAVNYGSSFILAAELGPAGLQARALLTYGNSSDPASPHYRDQLEAFTAGTLRPVRFTEADIAADPALVTEDITGP